MSTRRRKGHSPEQIVKKPRDADAMLNTGKEFAAVLQGQEVSEATHHRRRNQYGGMKSEQAKRLARQFLAQLVPRGVVSPSGDDTVTHHPGKKVHGKRSEGFCVRRFFSW
jgi:hypothetical protein